MSADRVVKIWELLYVAFVTAYINGVWPGSTTNTKFHEKGTEMRKAASKVIQRRSESHTLYWKDVKLIRKEDGIACEIAFRFTKGH